MREGDDCKACGLFQVFFEDDDGGVFAATELSKSVVAL